MGYKRMTAEDLYEIFRRYHAGQFKREIARVTEKDRKTVREYLKKLDKMGCSRKKPFPEKEALYKAIYKVLPKTEKSKDAYWELEAYEDRFRELINASEDPVKAKTAYEIVKVQERITASYTSFKRFASEKKLGEDKKRTITRIELPPGQETQIDYGKMGLLYDKKTGRKRVVNGFLAKLSCSRYPFIQFVYSQNQESFVNSVIDGFEFFGGVTERVSIDNLKAGVIKKQVLSESEQGTPQGGIHSISQY